MKDINFLVVGVGGQGTILAGDILTETGMLAGYDVKKSDVLGLAIRGGSVVSHVRWGEKVDAPMSIPGNVDYLLAFEPLEALRQIDFLHPESTVITNDYAIPPVSVSSGQTEYPEPDHIQEVLASHSRKLYHFDATTEAVSLGSVKTVNVLLLGALSALLDIPEKVWEEGIKKFAPQRFMQLNIDAFYTGRKRIHEKEPA
jgi:indolepyruvate ferredoxin oxidoreductase beta subunit